MLTALNQPADQVKGLRGGANDYLTKPFDLSIFNARIDAWSRTQRNDLAIDSTKTFLT
jgi:DNA-binding response OmpR family regulator